MLDTARTILKNKRTLELDDKCMSIKEILELIPGTK
jgi:phosphoenolpyruvate phosphomutase